MRDEAWGSANSRALQHTRILRCLHISKLDMQKRIEKKKKETSIRLFHKGARPKSRNTHSAQARSTEGGPWLLVRKRRPARIMESAKACK
eukprot:1035219-Pyramimonas_sp.AAC.1